MSSGLSSRLARNGPVMYNSAIVVVAITKRIAMHSPCFSLIAMIASLLGFRKFPAPLPRHAVLCMYFEMLSAVSGNAVAIFPVGREFAGGNGQKRWAGPPLGRRPLQRRPVSSYAGAGRYGEQR
jgi:hypothetical protein